jgi:hypothetical protein
VSLVLNIDTKTPTEIDQAASASAPITANVVFDPPRLLRKINIACCFGHHVFLLKGVRVLEEVWNGSLVRDFTQLNQGLNQGGILFDTYQNFTSNGAFNPFPATFVKYEIDEDSTSTIVSPSDNNTIDAGSVRDILGGEFNEDGDGIEKITQKVKITVSGPGKIGIGDPNNTLFKDLTDGSLTFDSSLGDDFDQHVFVCKDAQRNGICDVEECFVPPTSLCSDGLDNDGDTKIDFPADIGCSNADDSDEVDPLIEKTVTLSRAPQPVVNILPLLKNNEILKFSTNCSNCTIQSSPDPSTIIGGTALANEGFVIVATLVNTADQSLSHTIVVVGNAQQQSKLSTADGLEYVSQGSDRDTQFPASVLLNEQNEYFIKARVDNQFEQVPVVPTPLLAVNNALPKNGALGNLLFQGKDSLGTTHILVTKGRSWDASKLDDPSFTPEPFFTFFQGKGALSQCAQGFQNYPSIGELFENPTGFQLFLDLLTLCQR